MKPYLLFFITALAGISVAQAQVKVGSNPTTISPTSNLEVEAGNGTKVTIQKADGKVGIGTSSPTNTLHVAGSARVETMASGAATDSVVTVDANGVLTKRSVSAVAGVATNFYKADGTLTGNRTVSQGANWLNFTGTGGTTFNSGNVGIGTTTPAATLDVNGNLASRGQAFVNMAPLASDKSLNVLGQIISLRKANDEFGQIAAADDNYLGGNYHFMGLQYYAASSTRLWDASQPGSPTQPSMAGAGVLAGQNTSNLFIGSNASAGSKIYFGNAQSGVVATLDGIGRLGLGVGNFTPTNMLHVAGSARVETMASGAATDSVVTVDTNGVLTKRSVSAVAGVATNFYKADGTLTGNRTVSQGANWLNFTGTGGTTFNSGKVGIGTTTPATALDVTGTINATSNLNLGLNASGDRTESVVFHTSDANNANGSGDAIIYRNGGANGGLVVNNTGNGDLVLQNGAQSLAVVAPGGVNGGVGILNFGSTSTGGGLMVLQNGGEGFIGGNMANGDIALIGYSNSSTKKGLSIANSTGASGNIRIDPSGNVGVNTITPAATLDVNGTLYAKQAMRTFASSGDEYVEVLAAANDYFSGPSYSGTGLRYFSNSSTSLWPATQPGSPTQPSMTSSAQIFGQNVANVFIGSNASSGSNIYFGNGQMGVVATLDGNGKLGLGIGNFTPTEQLSVYGNIVATGTITQASDARFKENVATLSGSLDKLTQLRGVSYTHKAEFIKTRALKEGNQIGFIAQELEQIFPEFVITSSDGYKSVDYARLTPVLVESLKEVNAKLEAQQAEINELKAAVKQLLEKK